MEKPAAASRFREFLDKYGRKKLAIAAHNRADTDALSSAYALSRVLPGSVLCSSEEMNEGATLLAGKLGIKVADLSSLDKKNFDGLVVVDTSTYALLPDAKGWKVLLVIDHHRGEGRDIKGEFEIVDADSPSSAEIVTGLLRDELDRNSAFGLAVGVIADGARFKSARAGTFEALAFLMKKADAPYSELLSFAEPDPDEDSKIAMLKAMQRVEFVYSSGYMIATSEVGSNESDAASLIAEAADVAFVAKWKDKEKETRISARARGSVKIPLNKVMDTVATELGGAGGGHQKAAGAALKSHTKESLKKCVEIFVRMAEEAG